MTEPATYDQPAGGTIPTLPDLMEQIEQRFIDGVERGQMHDDVADSISEAMAGCMGGDLFSLIALAKGCHAAAEANRLAGNEKAAEFMHSLGQLLLSHSVDTLAGLAALDVHLSGIARH